MGDPVVTKHHKVCSQGGDMVRDGTVEQMTIGEKQGFSHASTANVCGIGEENCSGHRDSAKPWTKADQPGTSVNIGAELTRKDSRLDKGFEIYKPDGLQELLQFARDFELHEALQAVPHRISLAHTEGHTKEADLTELKGLPSLNVKESPDKSNKFTEVLSRGNSMPTSPSPEDIVNCKEGMDVSCLEGSQLRSVPEKEAAIPCSLSDGISNLDGDLKGAKNSLDSGQVHQSVNSCTSLSLASIAVRSSQSQFTIPRPFSFAIDKRAQNRGSRQDGISHKAFASNGTSGHTCLKTPEVCKTLRSRLLVVDKAVCSECVKNDEDSSKKLSIHSTPRHRDEDAMSISSTKSCSPAPKANASRFTSATSFKFHSDVRAEKRKEYYTKLQERLTAKEKEMNQLQAKAQRDKDEEIRLLRKSLTFKAHPVPSFYQEGPPQKAELPKTPTTRAKSPNFSRRETNFRGSTRFCNNMKCKGDHRISFSPQKLENRSKTELYCCEKSFEKKSLAKSSERISDGNASESVFELLDTDPLSSIELADIHIKVRDPLIVSSELLASDDDGTVHLEHNACIKQWKK